MKQTTPIIKVNDIESLNIIETRKPLGKFYTKEDGKYIGIDNSTGDAWTEEFDSYHQMFRWLSS